MFRQTAPPAARVEHAITHTALTKPGRSPELLSNPNLQQHAKRRHENGYNNPVVA
jgi:hypothetical protein